MKDGTFTNIELVETLIVDLNNLLKCLIEGQYVLACSLVAQMGQKLANLRNGIQADLDGKDRVIEGLKEQLRNTGAEVTDMSPEEFVQKYGKKDGAE